MNKMTKEEFYKMADEQADRIIDSFGKKKEPRNYKHKFIDTCEDGRVKVKITCHNRWLNKEVSKILNYVQLGTIPFPGGHVSKLIVSNIDGETYTLYGFFTGDIREHDECLYIDGIVDTLESGATDEFFGGYG
ncbi:MAG: hypothetical protein HRU40_21450 [Saprospiraceae bacterium]|nr:hypothetical protein [Saprospiraceae bacterium]